MSNLPKKLHDKIVSRQHVQSLRALPTSSYRVDFSSNDYLGFARSKTLFEQTHQYLVEHKCHTNGATGSRLLSGNHELYNIVETLLAKEYHADSSLIFNSGYDANVGFFSAVPQRGDVILYDVLSHASIRDGIQMSYAKSYKFAHNDLEDLAQRLQQLRDSVPQANSEIYVVTESIFSMDGDQPDLNALVHLCEQYNAHLIVDEAHAVGVFGKQGKGLISEFELTSRVFARIITFGKSLGCHGAAILGSTALRTYLINFARSFIYTTALSPHALASIYTAHNLLSETTAIAQLRERIQYFKKTLETLSLAPTFISSNSAIHCCVVPGNAQVKAAALGLQQKGFDVKPILSPTVPEGQERLRFCLHAYNTEAEIVEVLQRLAGLVNSEFQET